MNPRARVMRRQAAEARKVDVGVVADDVDEGVMQDHVLPTPKVRAAADEVEARRHELVHERPIGVSAMTRVVHDIEADTNDCKSQRDCQWHGLPPRVRSEDEQQ